MTRYTVVPSPIGPLVVAGEEGVVTALSFGTSVATTWIRDESDLGEAAEQLGAYFDGTRTRFDFPIAPRGTPFQQEVWAAVCEVPYGSTTTYGEIARRIGRPSAVRAVGRANATNPIAIVVPCHRVVGSTGALTGYGGGLDVKRRLIDHERSLPA